MVSVLHVPVGRRNDTQAILVTDKLSEDLQSRTCSSTVPSNRESGCTGNVYEAYGQQGMREVKLHDAERAHGTKQEVKR